MPFSPARPSEAKPAPDPRLRREPWGLADARKHLTIRALPPDNTPQRSGPEPWARKG